MTRIAELRNKYPSIHKDIIVKWEVSTSGVRDSNDLDKVSFWKPAAQGTYLSYDEELTRERFLKETPWRVRDNLVLLPGTLLMKTGLGLRLSRRAQSPYAIGEISEGEFGLFEGREMVDVKLYGSPPEEGQGPELATSKGTPVQDLVELVYNSFEIVAVRFCEYFNEGEECQFCNFNPTQEDAHRAGFDRPVTINPDETAEAFRILGSEVRLLEGCLISGGFRKSEAEASVNHKFVEKLNNSLPYRTYLKLVGQAMPRRELVRLRDAGLAGIRLQMEVFDERLFALIVPGKAKHMSRDGWLECFQDAVDVFGAGNVGAKFVGGVTLQGPHGYKSWQDARDSHMEGDRWMISHGVFPSTQHLRWAPGSPFSKDPANRDKFAPTEYYLDLMVAHHAAMKEYGLYEKLSKFLYCGLWRPTWDYRGEMGMLEIAGDVGNWMSAAVPYEQNWIARFLDSTRSPAGT